MEIYNKIRMSNIYISSEGALRVVTNNAGNSPKRESRPATERDAGKKAYKSGESSERKVYKSGERYRDGSNGSSDRNGQDNRNRDGRSNSYSSDNRNYGGSDSRGYKGPRNNNGDSSEGRGPRSYSNGSYRSNSGGGGTGSTDGQRSYNRSSEGGYRGNNNNRTGEGGYRGNSTGRTSEGGYRGNNGSGRTGEGGYRGNGTGRTSEGGYRSSSEGGYRGNSSNRSSDSNYRGTGAGRSGYKKDFGNRGYNDFKDKDADEDRKNMHQKPQVKEKPKEAQPDKTAIINRLEKEKKAVSKKKQYETAAKDNKAVKAAQPKPKRSNNIDWTKEYENGSYDDDDLDIYL